MERTEHTEIQTVIRTNQSLFPLVFKMSIKPKSKYQEYLADYNILK